VSTKGLGGMLTPLRAGSHALRELRLRVREGVLLTMRRARLVAASVAAVLLAGSLSGCLADGYTNHPSDGGRPSGDVAAAVEALPGVANVDAYTVPWYSPGEGGLFSSRGMDLVLWVTIDPEWHIVDGAEFLRQVGSAAWSINDGYSPDGDVNLIVRRGVHANHDWAADAAAVFGEGTRVTRDPGIAFMYYENEPSVREEDAVLSIAATAYEKAFGAWPAAPDVLDAELLAEGAPELEDPYAVGAFHTSGVVGGGDNCVNVSFSRAVGLDGEPYRGDVTVTLFVGSSKYGEQVARGSTSDENGGESGVAFCGDDAPTNRIGDVSSNVFAPAAPGFREVDRAGVTADW